TEADQSRALLRLTVRWIESERDRLFRRLVVERRGDRWVSAVESAPLVSTMRLASAEIHTSLLEATDEARLPESIATQIVDVFDDIDFQSDMRRGDRFRVVYESLEGDGESLGAGRVLSVDFTTGAQTRQAIWFQPPGLDALTGKSFPAGYFTPTGRSLRRAYLASPVEFSHVSSGFQMRTHPISKAWRQHLGVDYAAPAGTSVRSVGDGVVEFAGTQNGYGNVVIVQHHNNQSTLYAHLSKIGVKPGQVVSQGDYVGRVGSTGWATGPHLHFEFRVDGLHRDPETLAEQSDTLPLTEEASHAFRTVAALMQVQLAAAESTRQASAE
ncbi:MAG: M23 family metallopeptidase, partial [Burkholderiales bacterium]